MHSKDAVISTQVQTSRIVSRESVVFITTLEDRLREFLSHSPDFFRFLGANLELADFTTPEAELIDSEALDALESVRNHSNRFLINLQRLNDIRYLNQYFLSAHRKLQMHGVFVGRAETLPIHKSKFFRKFPGRLGKLFYPFHFMVTRVFPKVPGIKKVYFAVTQGKKRVLSQAEILGRLYYCGFRIAAMQETGDAFYFIARKNRAPAKDLKPSYGPVIQLKRIGYGGETIYINKLRTMHPYSEYLQEYIYTRNRLKSNGKLNGDFRITEWGNLFRKCWLDELPQFLNLLKGEINLVGVRALSEHYFTLYPNDLKQLRLQQKPGLIPPFYADLPNNFDEILESERRYLRLRRENPLKTDVIYLLKALYNILFRNARSM